MASEFTTRVEGLNQTLRALHTFDEEAQLAIKAGLREGGELVRRDAEARFEPYSAKTAQGFRVYARQFGARISVEQKYRKTTGKHPEWGTLQMRVALLPSLAEKQGAIVSGVERTLQAAAARV